MKTDSELLLEYAENRSETAFAEFVKRHLNLVYFAALRQAGGRSDLAKDVTQAVFTDLARKAKMLSQRSVLTSWLHTSTRFATSKALRAERRRRHYEQESKSMNELVQLPTVSAAWDRLHPVIDEALHALAETDRDVILLRFFEGNPFAEIARKLSLSEDAAQKRVERALDRLRVQFVRRGITSTTAGLSVALAHGGALTAPAGLADLVTTAGLGQITAGSSASTAILALLPTISWSLASLILILGAILGLWHRVILRDISRLESEHHLAAAEQRRLAAKNGIIRAQTAFSSGPEFAAKSPTKAAPRYEIEIPDAPLLPLARDLTERQKAMLPFVSMTSLVSTYSYILDGLPEQYEGSSARLRELILQWTLRRETAYLDEARQFRPGSPERENALAASTVQIEAEMTEAFGEWGRTIPALIKSVDTNLTLQRMFGEDLAYHGVPLANEARIKLLELMSLHGLTSPSKAEAALNAAADPSGTPEVLMRLIEDARDVLTPAQIQILRNARRYTFVR